MKDKPRIYIDEGQEFVMGNILFKWSWLGKPLKSGIHLEGLENPMVAIETPTFKIEGTKIKKSRRKKNGTK